MSKAIGVLLVLVSSACGQAVRSNPQPVSAPEVPSTVAELTSTTTEAIPAPTTTIPAPVATSAPRPASPATTEYLQPVATTRLYGEQAPSNALASIRACESRGVYSTDTGNGYYGAYQFSQGTWESVGGSGNPANASTSEQDMRAQMMIDAGRRGEWPNC